MHLEKVFTRALEYETSLNPRKCAFGVIEGKLLGNLVGKDGVRIDLERVEATDKIQMPKMFIFCATKNQDIIKINDNKLNKVIKENFIHEPQECRGGI